MYFPKSVYNNHAELVLEVQRKAEQINKNENAVKVVRKFLLFALPPDQYNKIGKLLSLPQTQSDIYTPSNDEIRAIIAQLPAEHRPVYLALVYSGLRTTEIQYILDKKASLRTQKLGDCAVKVEIAWQRGKKASYFAYLPESIWQELQITTTSIKGLVSLMKRKKLLPLKYCRKWFAQKCLEAGIKAEIVDFYQGRSQHSVLYNHYVNLQTFADSEYGKAVAKIRMEIG